MKLVETIQEMDTVSLRLRETGHKIKLIPTMGALHAGHAALIEAAAAAAKGTEPTVRIVSIFVNPIQFDHSEDFFNYPTTLETDLTYCEQLGVDYVFAPKCDEMYPLGAEKFCKITPALEMADELEGKSRPGHFCGVLTVVGKLINICHPHEAFFGEKDYQQLILVKKMCLDLNFSTNIIAVPIVREPDNLALSSRNTRLDPKARQLASKIHQILIKVRNLLETEIHFNSDELRVAVFLDSLHESPKIAELIKDIIFEEEEIFKIDYLAIRCATHFSAIIFKPERNRFDCKEDFGPCRYNEEKEEYWFNSYGGGNPEPMNAILAISAIVGDVRLLDNVPLKLD